MAYSRPQRIVRWFLILTILATSQALLAAQPSRFIAGKHNSGELRFIEGLPIATVSGSPEEIGEQLGTLMKQPVQQLISKQDDFARGFGLGASLPEALKSGLAGITRLLSTSFPDSQRRELQATAKAANVDPNLLTLANLMYELSRVPACSTIAVEPARSKTGAALFGRNLDFPTFGFLDQYSVVIVYHPKDKHAFASISFPGFVGVASGMNDAGLCLAQLEVNRSAESAPKLNMSGAPVAMCFRRLLEECTTIDEAEKLLREQKRLILCNLAVCDREHAAVFEITPNTVIRRSAERGFCPCTNHFRTGPLAVNTACSRYSRLLAGQEIDQLGVAEVNHLLDSVNQENRTIQTMIFEPAELRVHLSLGPPPSSSQPLKRIDLADYLRRSS